MNKQIIVLGMHRSGTSILSKLLIKLGVNMGDVDSIGNISNIDGHNEDYEMLTINEQLLASLERTWKEPPEQNMINQIEENIIKIYKDYVSRKKGLWGVKEPRLSLFAFQIDKVVKNPKYIYMTRNENDVAESLHVRNGILKNEAKILKKKYDTSITNFLNSKIEGVDYLCISYEELILTPEKVLKTLCDFLSLKYEFNAISHIKEKDLIVKLKKEKLKSNIKYLFVKAMKNPRKLISKNGLESIKSNLRRLKELYLK